jgi:hypothetical protein
MKLVGAVACATLLASGVAGEGQGTASTAAGMKEKQSAIQQTVRKIAEGIEATGDAEFQVRATLFALSTNELVEAVKLLDQLSTTRGADAAELVKRLTACQDRAIVVLEKILGVVDMLQAQTKEPEKAKAPTDLPPELVEKLKDLNKSLQEFLKEQKKVVEDTKDMAKQPMDDFTPQQQDKLKELAAIEDKWAKFLGEAYSDLSKLPVQDYSNPALLEELVQTYSEVELAKDALQKKAVEIATPLEENGAELAKSLQTNIEKWLPDYADRIQWKMEEPLQDYQVPMAELPKELEDLVGDLLEQEEDLMSDIEDATSAWADSMDKGAGWDALDGPISNMSAKGVTGNHLPGSQEIGGRSGEGRTGKSGGEFVGAEAVGKGGRRTPTRLTPDPFEKGEVRDKSQEPPGGATGGGKISGAGSQGLEGPTAPEMDRKMGPLAGRQAELRNKAEKVRLNFQVMNYPTEDISEVIKVMKAVEDEALNRRYENIARIKPVLLKDLSNVKGFVGGEMRVHQERGLGLPKHMQDEITKILDEEAPQGYEELLRGYYESLFRAR